jgi:hypothetical protein
MLLVTALRRARKTVAPLIRGWVADAEVRISPECSSAPHAQRFLPPQLKRTRRPIAVTRVIPRLSSLERALVRAVGSALVPECITVRRLFVSGYLPRLPVSSALRRRRTTT